jgi:hypothetical protein
MYIDIEMRKKKKGWDLNLMWQPKTKKTFHNILTHIRYVSLHQHFSHPLILIHMSQAPPINLKMRL